MGTYNGYYEINTVDLIDVFYPVGTIYETKDANFNPNTVWGGTWVRIQDKFLVAAGSTYTGTGGAASQSITLSSSNLPSHRHGFTPSGSVSSTFTGTAVTSGAGSAHSHTRGTMDITGSLRVLSWTGYDETSGCFTKTSSIYDQSCAGNHGFGANVFSFNASSNWSGSTSSESSHTHSVTAAGSVSSSFSGTADNTDYTGDGTAFTVNTIPPYQAVYIWERTA